MASAQSTAPNGASGDAFVWSSAPVNVNVKSGVTQTS